MKSTRTAGLYGEVVSPFVHPLDKQSAAERERFPFVVADADALRRQADLRKSRGPN